MQQLKYVVCGLTRDGLEMNLEEVLRTEYEWIWGGQ